MKTCSPKTAYPFIQLQLYQDFYRGVPRFNSNNLEVRQRLLDVHDTYLGINNRTIHLTKPTCVLKFKKELMRYQVEKSLYRSVSGFLQRRTKACLYIIYIYIYIWDIPFSRT